MKNVEVSLCGATFVNAVTLDLDDCEETLCETTFVDGFALELIVITLNDVALATVIVATCSCNDFVAKMKLLDDKNQIRMSIRTDEYKLNKPLMNLILPLIDKYELANSTNRSILIYKV